MFKPMVFIQPVHRQRMQGCCFDKIHIEEISRTFKWKEEPSWVISNLFNNLYEKVKETSLIHLHEFEFMIVNVGQVKILFDLLKKIW